MPFRLWLTMLLFSFLVFSAQLLCAQDPAPESPAVLYKLEGTVINAQTGRPLANALVEMNTPRKFAALTGDEGQFAFDNVPRGNFALSARKPGFFTPGATEHNSPFTSVDIGPQAKKVELKLIPEGVIFGQVTDDAGEPLEGASVEVLAISFQQGRRELTPSYGNTRTDEDGNFRMGGLHSGRYYLMVKAGPVARRILGAQAKDRAETYPALVYYPSADDIAAASPIHLAGGQRVQALFTLKRVPAFKLGGVMYGLANYRQVNPPMIVDQAGTPLLSVMQWDNQAGTFEFPALPAGTYALILGAQDAEGNFSARKETITLDHDRTDLALSLQAGVTIPVIVRTELKDGADNRWCSGGWAGSGGTTYDCRSLQAMVMLDKADSPQMQVSARPEGEKDAPALVFRSVMPGTYRVRVTTLVTAYIASIRCGAADLLREDLVVPDGGNVPPIEVVLRDGGGTVRVRVQSDSEKKRGRILLLPEFAPTQPPVDLDIDADGEREYGNLAPGEYKVLAFDSVAGLEYGNPEFLEKYSSKAGRVTLSPHSTSNVTVDLIHVGDLD